MCIPAPKCTWRPEEDTEYPIIFTLIPLRQESLTEAGARLKASHSLESFYVCSHSSGVTGILTH